MEIVVTNHHAGFPEPVAPLDWRFDDIGIKESGKPVLADATAKAEACAWARHACAANGFGAPEVAANETHFESAVSQANT